MLEERIGMMRAVFMGTPQFAMPALDAVCESAQIVGVFTQPDRPAGRGRRVEQSPVKVRAAELGLPVWQPRSLRGAAAQSDLRALAPDVIVVAAYGLILPQSVLDIPPFHCINVHASLLPRHRGASPIAAAILSGDTETGISLMQMDAGLDTGPIIATRAIPIHAEDTTASLEERLSKLGADLLRETLPHWLTGGLSAHPQPDEGVTTTRLIRKEDGIIDWDEPAEVIARKVRAYYPWPGASTVWQGQPLKIAGARAVAQFGRRGLVSSVDGALLVGTGDGSLLLERIQPAGKRQMSAAEFARGHREIVGAVLGGAK